MSLHDLKKAGEVLAIVVPCYNEGEILEITIPWLVFSKGEKTSGNTHSEVKKCSTQFEESF